MINFLRIKIKTTIITLLYPTLMINFAHAADNLELIENILQKKGVRLDENIDPGLVTVLNYYKNTYPNSPFAKLNLEEQQKLLLRANDIKLINKDLDNGTILNQALKPVIDPGLVTVLNYYKNTYPNSPFAKLNLEEQQKLLLRANNIKLINKDLDNGTILNQGLNKLYLSIAKKRLILLGYINPPLEQLTIAKRLVDFDYKNFTDLQFRAAQRLTNVLGEPNFTSQRLAVAVNLNMLGIHNLIAAQLNYFDDITKIVVLEGMAANPVLYNRLDTFIKLQAIFNSYNIFPPADEILLFASRVNSEHLFLNDIEKQIKQVNRAYALMGLNQGNDYNGAMSDRRDIYAYMTEKGYDTDVDAGGGLFELAINEIKEALRLEPNENMRPDDDVSVGSGLKILKFDEDIFEDFHNLKQKFDLKINDLLLRLNLGEQALQVTNHYEQIILNGWQNQVDYDDIADRRNYNNDLQPLKDQGAYYIKYYDIRAQIDRTIDINQDTRDVINKVDQIALTKVANPIRLNYKALTYEDYLGSLLQRDLRPVPVLDFNNIKNEALRVVDNADFLNPQLAQAYRDEITQKFDRVAMHVGVHDAWKERISEIWRKVPEDLINANIARPGTQNYDVVLWNTSLENSKKLVLQNIIGAISGCNTGVNQKLGLLEQGWRGILGGADVPIHTGLIAPIASIIKNLKMKKIEELGRNNGPRANVNGLSTLADEENVTAPALATERLRIGWGLGGDFQEIVGPRYGFGFDPKNSPVQITSNLFEAAQPQRLYNVGTEDVPVYQNIAVDPPITVKSLVDAVYDEFDKSITYTELLKFVNGSFDLRKDRLNPLQEMENGIFINERNTNLGKEYFSRNMAFYVLEKLNYIEITPLAKQELYDGDESNPGEHSFMGNTRSLHEWIESDAF